MWVRAVAFLSLAFFAAACSKNSSTVPDHASLKLLGRLSAEGSNFGVVLDAKTGKPLSAFRVNRPIRAAVPDGDGGWYIGGGFIRVNSVLRKRLAHIRADGALDPDWQPEANGNGVSVTALARIGSRLYVAGDFARLDRAPRRHLGAIDVRSGELDAGWRPATDRPYWNYVLLPDGKRLLVGGGSGLPASSVVALDPRTGRRDPTWHGNVDSSNLEGGGTYLLARSGPRIYVGGVFRAVEGVPRSGITALDADTGRLDKSWRSNLGFGACYGCTFLSFAVRDGSLYGSLNGPSRSQVIALDAVTGRVDPRLRGHLGSTTAIYGGTAAYALVTAGPRIYVAGDFDRVNGKPQHGFAALDAQTARVLPGWNPRANTVYGSFLAVSGSRLLLGIELSPQVGFDLTGLKTFVPVRRLRVTLALSGPGTVGIGIGRRCNYRRWTETARCDGHVIRHLDRVSFEQAERRRYDHALPIPPGRYFVRFVPRATGGPPQAPYDFPITVR
jgi:beta-propeller uncharacterized protein DUF5122